jgi:hypothetical protein
MRAWTTLVPIFVATAAAAQVPPMGPYVDPPFASECTIRHFDEGESPDFATDPADPYCVEYEKRDITASNGGAVRFLAAEPARFAQAIPRCRYWQQDHWRVNLAPGVGPLVQWDGSYWFDLGTGTAAGRLRNFRIGGQPAGIEQVAVLLDPLAPDLAALVRQFGDGPDGGGGAVVCLGMSAPHCAAPAPSGRCFERPGDVCEVAAARGAVAAQCDCAGAPDHGTHVRCAGGVADTAVAEGRLAASCRKEVVRCASSSTCGRAGRVTCCRIGVDGRKRCGIKRDGAACRPPRGGTACIGTAASCCDACTAPACPAP